MARIVLGIGTSHGPLLTYPPEFWGDRVQADRANTRHVYKGKTYTFDDLAAARKHEKLEEQITPEICEARYAKCQRSIAALAETLDAKRPDVAVIVGDDQMEVFGDHIPIPALAIFWGEYVEGIPRTPELFGKLPSPRAEPDRTPPVYTRYPCVPGLARLMIENVVADGFDVAALTQLPYGPLGNSVGHAYGFIYRRLMRDSVIPNIPVFINTYYPPNQPTAGRCFDFGRSLAHAISSWPEDRTVCIFASGGLSHFAVDESLDHMVLEAMRRHDRATLSNIPEAVFQSGTSEIKTWITVAGAMMEAGLEMTLVDYVPCYRSEAGTGCGMAFARWQ